MVKVAIDAIAYGADVGALVVGIAFFICHLEKFYAMKIDNT
jgi:hypothetical protein